jgi:3-deoxy-manno-octulosonate cytidylyltransferase (CMP-KDO synthetase)
LPAGKLEQIESLEQLRLLENGIEVVVGEAIAAVPGGVDTPADLQRVRAQLAGAAH